MKTHRDGLTISELHQRTLRRLFLLRTKGYEVHVKWECEFLKELKTNPKLKKQYDDIWIPKPLDPRGDALRGVRTEPFQFYWRAPDPTWEIIWVDVVGFIKRIQYLVICYNL